MRIQLDKFGKVLSSRPAGREAWLIIQPTLKKISSDEIITIDFKGVGVLTPSWADEFVTPIMNMYGSKKVVMELGDNPSVVDTIQFLKDIW